MRGLLIKKILKISHYFLLILIFSRPHQSSYGFYRKGYGTEIFGRHFGSTLEIDFSKSYISGYLDFSERKLKARKLTEKNTLNREIKFYSEMFLSALVPKYLLLEADFFPLTNLGIYLNQPEKRELDNYEIHLDKTDVNPIRLMASRYEEPYSYALFLGEIFPFYDVESSQDDAEETKKENKNLNIKQSGSAIMGHVFSVGSKSVINLIGVTNHWFQYVFKIKGSNETATSKRKWTFQAGVVNHESEYFFDSLIFQFQRDIASKNDPSFFNNLKIDYIFQIPIEQVKSDVKFHSYTNFQKIIFGRNIYINNVIISLDFGFKWEVFKELNESKTFSRTSIIIAPNISF
jgi:hypothetical protein